MTNRFSSYHPATNFFYFLAVILLTMFLMNPVFLLISLSASLAYSAALNEEKSFRRSRALFFLPAVAIIAVFNPLFVHEGKTALFRLGSAPVTLESVCYGLSAALMFASVLLWFSCYNRVMSTDKFLSLFGRSIPSLSLLVSMTLRLIPHFRRKIEAVSRAQKTLGMDMSAGSVRQRLRHGVRIFSIVMSWALENAVGTADSMKARGYGLRGRTTFSRFRLEARDTLFLTLFGGAAAVCAAGIAAKAAAFRYYPSIECAGPSPAFTIVTAAAYLFLCGMPLALEIHGRFR